MCIPSARRDPAVALAVIAGLAGTIVALHYHWLGLTLSHYDARGHLVVARRIIDSLTPGWQQIGAVWLPLPHLLNALPVQVDAWYQSGASAVAISIAAFAVTAGAIAWIVLHLTGSNAAAVAGAAAFALNPNVLYLQSTPMTEPLLMGLVTLAVTMLFDWCNRSRPGPADADAELWWRVQPPSRPRRFGESRRSSRTIRASVGGRTRPTTVGCVFALACLTRYEAWPVTAAALAAALWALWRQGASLAEASRGVAAIAVLPAAAIAGFLVFSRVVIGQWFVSSGFFVPENPALGNPALSVAQIWFGLHSLSGSLVLAVAAAGVIALIALGVTTVRWSSALIVVSLGAAAALPWLAFVAGHPFRIRYMVPLVVLEAIAVGVAAGLLPRGRPAAIAVVVAMVAYDLRPLDPTAPMVVEAQWDRPNVPFREQVTACIARSQPEEKIMASMGSLGHYMQETSRAGFRLRDFLHEGNGDIWLSALARGPRAFAEWVLIEEKAEGGDMLAVRAREDPRFLDGYARVCEGAGLALYRRDEGKGHRAEIKGQSAEGNGQR